MLFCEAAARPDATGIESRPLADVRDVWWRKSDQNPPGDATSCGDCCLRCVTSKHAAVLPQLLIAASCARTQADLAPPREEVDEVIIDDDRGPPPETPALDDVAPSKGAAPEAVEGARSHTCSSVHAVRLHLAAHAEYGVELRDRGRFRWIARFHRRRAASHFQRLAQSPESHWARGPISVRDVGPPDPFLICRYPHGCAPSPVDRHRWWVVVVDTVGDLPTPNELYGIQKRLEGWSRDASGVNRVPCYDYVHGVPAAEPSDRSPTGDAAT